jgi:hypothetical protein
VTVEQTMFTESDEFNEFVSHWEREAKEPVYGCTCGHVRNHDSECALELLITSWEHWKKTGEII